MVKKKNQHVQIKKLSLNIIRFLFSLLLAQVSTFKRNRKAFLERKSALQGYTAQDCIHFLAEAEQQQTGQSA